MQLIPCFLCSDKLEKRIDKNGKPYFVCNPCGIQLFVRREKGMQRLEEYLSNADKAEIPFKQHARNLHEINAILQEIDGVKAQIPGDGFFGDFFLDDEQLRTRKLLKTRLDNLFVQLEELAKRKA